MSHCNSFRVGVSPGLSKVLPKSPLATKVNLDMRLRCLSADQEDDAPSVRSGTISRQTSTSRDGGGLFSAHSTAALLIDSPGVLGPLAEPCLSPTFRSLTAHSRCGSSAVSKGVGNQLGAAKTLSFSSVRSYSGGRVPVLDSVTSLRDEPLGRRDSWSSGGGGADGNGGGEPLPAAAAALLQHAELAYEGARSLAVQSPCLLCRLASPEPSRLTRPLIRAAVPE